MASLPLQFSEIDMAGPSKKNKRNRTYKNKKDLGSRVKSFLTAMEGGDEGGLEDFQPGRSDPNLAGTGQRGKVGQVDMANELKKVRMANSGRTLPPSEDVAVDNAAQLSTNMDATSYYKQYVPYYTNLGNQHSVSGGQKDELLEKLNYMIHLLEENQDEKTSNVTEELILYLFLGVFVIFTVDSFARAGKYTR